MKLEYRKTKARIKLIKANQIYARTSKKLKKQETEPWFCGICEFQYKTRQNFKKHANAIIQEGPG